MPGHGPDLRENRQILTANTDLWGKLNLVPTSLWQGFRKNKRKKKRQRTELAETAFTCHSLVSLGLSAVRQTRNFTQSIIREFSDVVYISK